ncbi:hypothetical protein DDI_0074 [Dickeya dianthicola RNS04.9]|nr:hypothetical protein DDI_0074 [Dickeya dianthicola RNS04.9]
MFMKLKDLVNKNKTLAGWGYWSDCELYHYVKSRFLSLHAAKMWINSVLFCLVWVFCFMTLFSFFGHLLME